MMRGLGVVHAADVGGGAGAAALARALGEVAAATGQRVTSASSADAQALPELAAASRLIILVTPAHTARAVARQLGDVVTGAHLIVHTARGLEPGSGLRVSEILREETCVLRVGILAGPVAVEGLGAGDPEACVVGSRFDDVITEAKRMLAGARLRVYGNHDIIGVELAAALGAALSFGVGIAAGLGFGRSTRAVMETRGLGELARLGVKLGGNERTFFGLSGVGARMAYGADEGDESFQYGEALAKGDRPANEPEGVRAAREAGALAERHGVRTPLLLALRAMADGTRSPRDVGKELMVSVAVDE